jgi:hypothetical protein
MTFKTAYIRTALRRRFFSLIMGATAALAVWTIAETAQGQQLGISGWQDAAAARWQRLTNQPPFDTDTALLLTDGTVMVHEYGNNNWWRLTPDINGSYLNGTWSQLASMSPTYGPLYFASAVLPDGRVIVEGGEYNFLQFSETNKGAIYNPTTNSWTTVNPPSGWSSIGDSPGVVRQDGTFMLGQNSSKNQALFNATTLTWTVVGSGKADTYSEEGYCLLPGGSILLVDCANGTNSELFNPSTNQWSTAGSTVVKLPDAGSLEIGPHIQRPNGTSVAFGGTIHNAIYNFSTGTWTPTADFPGGNDMADAPGCLLPDGNILVFASPGIFQTPASFFVFDGITFTPAPNTQSGHNLTSYQSRMLLLPTGQVLWVTAEGSTIDVELLTSKGTPDPAWAPTITSVPRTLTRGASFQISGTQFNGLSVGADYGDDATMATNYPLVRITNDFTNHVFYARTHDHSTMGIATGTTIVSTTFDVPVTAETGASKIVVVANGIPSRPKRVTIQ